MNDFGERGPDPRGGALAGPGKLVSVGTVTRKDSAMEPKAPNEIVLFSLKVGFLGDWAVEDGLRRVGWKRDADLLLWSLSGVRLLRGGSGYLERAGGGGTCTTDSITSDDEKPSMHCVSGLRAAMKGWLFT